MTIILGDLSRLYTKTEGDVTLTLQDKSSLKLKDCIYVPKMRRNLISTYYLYEDGFHTTFSDKVSIIKNDKEIHQALIVNGRCVLYPKVSVEPPEKEE